MNRCIAWLAAPLVVIGLWTAGSAWAADGQSGDVGGVTGCQIATATPATGQVLSATGSKTCAWSAPAGGTTLTNSLGGDVSLNNTGTYFDGPSVAQGTTGTWCTAGTVTVLDSNSASLVKVKLWDGTTVIASTEIILVTNANSFTPVSLSGCIASPASNIKISVEDTTTTSGVIRFNASGNSKDSTITVWRVS